MKSAFPPALLIASILAGCTSPQAPLTPRTPHGGMIFALSEVPGSIEVVRRTIADKPGVTRLTLYYLDGEMKPISPSPTAASFKSRGRGGKSIDFKPSADTDPSRAGGLESADLPDQGDLDGELSVTIDGKPVTLSISVR